MPIPSIRYTTLRNIDQLPQFERLSSEQKFALRVVGSVLPFRVNNYVVDELIDWDAVPDDPIYNLTFMQEGMLRPDHFERMAHVLRSDGNRQEVQMAAEAIRRELNPHPAGQMSANVPMMDEEPVPGIQHKYRETCLVFPRASQTCHSYCTFCFRWPQFTGMSDLKFATDQANTFADYIRKHTEITDVLFTGGDPMVMNERKLRAYIEPLLGPGFEHVRTIRIGTKSLAYWPYRYVTDKDADGVLSLFEKIEAAGKHLAIMAHFNHGRELSTPIVRKAIQRIRNTGAQIRTQSPVIAHINDHPDVWADMWQTQVELGCVPYYMFVERDTGAKHFFSIPLERAHLIFQQAIQQVSGVARTVRGPSMSAYPGKVRIDGTAEIKGEKVFVLSLLQARNPDDVHRPFFARYDPQATWWTDLKPAFGEETFFFQHTAGSGRTHQRADRSGTGHRVLPGARSTSGDGREGSGPRVSVHETPVNHGGSS
jgi:KamA family protein